MERINKESYLKLLLTAYLAVLIWSAIAPKTYLLWFLEVVPAVAGLVLLILNYRNIKFESVTYTWCFIAACFMTVGAHYSYAEMPLFNWIQEIFNLDRNNYDKVGHFIQGIVPIVLTQELLIKKVKIKNVFWINFLAIGVSIAVSAIYEIIEWFTVLSESESAEDFLGAQGYIWDTQSDMFLAALGALFTVFFSRKFVLSIIKETSSSHSSSVPQKKIAS